MPNVKQRGVKFNVKKETGTNFSIIKTLYAPLNMYND